MGNPLWEALFAPHEGAGTPFLHLPDGAVLTHGAFLDRAARMATALRQAGAGPGDRIAVQVEKCPDMLAVYAACVKAGIVFLPQNTAYTPAEVDYFVGDSGARLLLADPAAEGLAAVVERHGAALMTLAGGGAGSLAAAADGAAPMARVEAAGEDDLAAILYTSGTTGRSKGAMLSQRNLLSNAQALATAWGFTADDVLIHALPIFHTHGLFVATNISLLAGGAMIFLPKFDADAVIDALPRATSMMGVPTFYTRLLASERFTREAAAHMRLFVSGSAPLLAETHRAFEARTGSRILERYGMTETNMNTSNPLVGERRAGTVGPALPGVEVKVCDGEGRELPRGEIGTVEVRGPNVFLGYWQMPEKTAEELRPSGFFNTGDLGVMAQDGYLTIVGRAKDLVISGGLNVYPKEVEDALDALPGVEESAVIGVPHPDLGEAVVAVVVPEAGYAPDEAGLLAGLADLAGFKRPKRIVLVGELPRNTMGKVQKAALRAAHAGLFG
ncbi:malonate--CoA ligase [Wenxinia marina]|uniref:Acyl-CoA synthetase (AMP-forming)/AMP-acid ligase II n=1 Tax=Wenxinia marina DSM 24838 TaxID=1123501 RepID=A0A0D0QBZ1_9RHOB|nr:malonyl-CoA synthase [Wenxinia marina]KIQ68473.1 Acyl-CoA synthetase (AMP-forming)/AMP-acid ligase II [Wenxinia marina DSM 24838]GGL66046.1 malonyl-CoA synthase [Wenxinia marina]